jgi:hypothetical protein
LGETVTVWVTSCCDEPDDIEDEVELLLELIMPVPDEPGQAT